jgi:hypothetical protein
MRLKSMYAPETGATAASVFDGSVLNPGAALMEATEVRAETF